MTAPVESGLVTMMLIAGIVGAVVGIGIYVWYALALSRLFPRIDGEGWKGWVPILNEAEILARGGVPAWSVVFYFIPLVQFYGLYLKVVATHRINKRFGRGAGMTVLAILLPPVWATVLAWGAPPYPEGDRLDALQPGPRRTPQPSAAPARDASGYTIPSLAPHAPGAPADAPAAPAGPSIPGFVPVPRAQDRAPEPSVPAPPSAWGAPSAQGGSPAASFAPPQGGSSPASFAPPQGEGQAPSSTPQYAPSQPPAPQFASPQPPAPQDPFAQPAAPQPPAPQPPAPQSQPSQFAAPQPPAPQPPAPQVAPPQPPATHGAAPDPAFPAQPPAPQFAAPQPLAAVPPAPSGPAVPPAAPVAPAASSAEPAPAAPSAPAPEPSDAHPTTGIMAAMGGMPAAPVQASAHANAAPASDAQTPDPYAADAATPEANRTVRPAPPSFRTAGDEGEGPQAPSIRPAPTSAVEAPEAGTPVLAPPVLPAAAEAAPVADAPMAPPVVQPFAQPVAPPGAPLGGLADEVDKTVVSPRPTDDDLDATVVVARKRGVRRSLVLDDGRTFLLSGARVVIGRNPVGDPGEQRLAITDMTRTLSKTHARLVVTDDEWRLTDLHATNGVVVVADDGSETLLDPGESVVGNGRFILGEVGMHVVAERDS